MVTYTSCDTVDLYVNSTKIGTKKSSDFAKTGIVQWRAVPWEAGVIKAVGMKDGKEVAVDSIKTAGAPAKVVLKPDRTTLYADGNDASCIEVDIEDADNNGIFSANNTVQFTMTGPGRNIGIASGDFVEQPTFQGHQQESLPRQGADRHSIAPGSRNDQRDGEFRGFDSGQLDPDHPAAVAVRGPHVIGGQGGRNRPARRPISASFGH